MLCSRCPASWNCGWVLRWHSDTFLNIKDDRRPWVEWIHDVWFSLSPEVAMMVFIKSLTASLLGIGRNLVNNVNIHCRHWRVSWLRTLICAESGYFQNLDDDPRVVGVSIFADTHSAIRNMSWRHHMTAAFVHPEFTMTTKTVNRKSRSFYLNLLTGAGKTGCSSWICSSHESDTYILARETPIERV